MKTTNGGSRKQSPRNNDKAMETGNIPAVCQFWRNLYLSLPHIELFGLDIQLTLATAVALTILRYVVEYALIFVWGWPLDHMTTKWAAGSLVAIFHSMNLIPGLLGCFASHPYAPSEKFEEATLWWQQTVHALLQFCTGYMIYDSVVNYIFVKSGHGLDAADLMFLGHHFATSFYMTTARFYKAGHMSAMMCMLLGESTNPFHNGYYVAEAALSLDCCNGPWMQQFMYVNTFVFCSTYVLMRTIIAPVFCLHMTYDLWTKGRKNLPWWLILIWSLLIWAVVFGSYPWIVDCWNLLQPYISTETTGTEEL